MRKKEDNLLKIADEYENHLESSGFDCFQDAELAATFKEIISDYKTITNICKTEGLDINEPGIKELENEFKEAELDEKEGIVEGIKERISSLMDMCDNPPEKIVKKYYMDLFDLIDMDDY